MYRLARKHTEKWTAEPAKFYHLDYGC